MQTWDYKQQGIRWCWGPHSNEQFTCGHLETRQALGITKKLYLVYIKTIIGGFIPALGPTEQRKRSLMPGNRVESRCACNSSNCANIHSFSVKTHAYVVFFDDKTRF